MAASPCSPWRREYPPAERLDLVEDLHGHRIADPYRWLEDPADPRTETWTLAQDELVRDYFTDRPDRAARKEELTELLSAGVVGVPRFRGDRMFFTRREPGQEHAALIMVDGAADPADPAAGAQRVLVDTGALDPSGLTTLDTWSVSIEGRRLAYQLSVGGDEESRLYVIDTDSGELIEGPIDRCRYSAVAWLPGGEEFFYVRRLAPDEVPAGEENLHRRVYRHRVGTDPAGDELVCGQGVDPTTFYDVGTSQDGRWLVVSAWRGTAPRCDVWISDLHGDAELREVQVGVDADLRAWVARDGLLYLLTDRDAPRRRLAVTDPETPDYSYWRDVVPESPDALLAHVALLSSPDEPGTGPGDEPAAVRVVLAAHRRDACTELSWYDPAAARRVGVVSGLPVGTVTGLSTRPEGGGECWIGYTDFLTPAAVLHWRVDSPDRVETWMTAPGAPSLSDVRVMRTHYTSLDGTNVHMFILAPGDSAEPGVEPDRPRPAILYGYGGFNNSLTPDYNPMAVSWVRSGGVYAIANLRGGSEHGEEWHRAGRRERKQNVFDDFHAAAEWLVAHGWTGRERLGIYGGSNGGLLVGVALTQRPELYSAVVCSKPLLDMIRYEHHGLGRLWTDEYGTVERAEEFEWLYGYSPYHRVRAGVEYPAVLFTTFEADSRVDPLHARKMCAALQHVAADGRAVLLRRELGVGHGARSVSRSAGLIADQLTFLAGELAP